MGWFVITECPFPGTLINEEEGGLLGPNSSLFATGGPPFLLYTWCIGIKPSERLRIYLLVV
jgi:hypothetical protein